MSNVEFDMVGDYPHLLGKYFDMKKYAKVCKRAAKKWYSEYIHADELAMHYHGWWKEAEETSTRRLELLRRLEWCKYSDMATCPICQGDKDYGQHVEGCELAKELADDDLGAQG